MDLCDFKEIRGLIIMSHRRNAHRTDAYGQSEDRQPFCRSMNGEQIPCATARGSGMRPESYNKFGSAGREACKNIHRLCVLRKNDILPVAGLLVPAAHKRMAAFQNGWTSGYAVQVCSEG